MNKVDILIEAIEGYHGISETLSRKGILKSLKEIKQELQEQLFIKCSGCKKPLNDGLCDSCCSDLASGNY